MKTISTLCVFIVGTAMFVTPILLLIFLVKWVRKKPKKKIGIATLISAASFVVFAILGTATDPATYCDHVYNLVENEVATCEKDGFELYHCDLCGRDREDKLEKLGHDMVDVRRVEPTYETDGEFVRGCTRCEYEEITILEKLTKPTETSPTTEVTEPTETDPPQTEPVHTDPPATQPSETESTVREPDVTFEEIYKAYKSNELAADDVYKGNRYRITATINGIKTGGLFNLTGGATLTMQTQIGKTIVFFYAEFEKEQEEALKTVAVGDVITFEGTCLSAGSWTDCEIVR